MFKWHKSGMGKTLDVITLFHKASSPASMRVHALLKKASADAAAHATEDQASTHSAPSTPKRGDFQLDVTEDVPTSDQLRNILEFVGVAKAGSVIKGARDDVDALKKFREDQAAFQAPVTVDWDNGRAVVGDNESEILKLVNSLPKSES